MMVVAVIFTDDLRGDSGRLFERLLRARLPSATVYYVDEASAAWLAPEVLAAVRQAKAVIAPIYIVPVQDAGHADRAADSAWSRAAKTCLKRC